MYIVASDNELQKAAKYLTSHDPVLAPVIAHAGICTIRPHNNYYPELVASIIGQQLSVKAAASIEKRFLDLFDGQFPSPAQIVTKNVEDLRATGLSRPKASYVIDLAQHILDGRVKFDHLDTLSNEAILKELTDVKGIGEWTVHMFLMFCMGRLDVLPVGDLGIRNSMRSMYGFDHLPTPADIKATAEKYQWHPYESVASWYIWQSLGNKPVSVN